MDNKGRKTIIAGNWKMYKTSEEASNFIKEVSSHIGEVNEKIYLSVPFTIISSASLLVKELGSPIVIGAQNMNDASEGAFTGEIAARMLKEAGAQFVLLGHSERRHIFGESSAFVNRKVVRAIKEGIQPIVCVGETLQQRESGQMEQVLEEQIKESLKGLKDSGAAELVLAYEPVWAIGTGKTATPEMAEEAHQFCRKIIQELFDEKTAEQMSILYGGSVKPENAKELLEKGNIDGLLIGGASLSADQFTKIIHYKKGNS